MIFRFQSVSSIVMTAARAGSGNSSRMVVIRTDQMKRWVWYCERAGGFMLMAVVMKLMAPRIEDTPSRWREKIARSTEAPVRARLPAKGGYMAYPVPDPASTADKASSSKKDGGSNQKLMLLMHRNAMPGAPIITGTSQFLNPPIINGVTMKKIITKVWAVTITL